MKSQERNYYVYRHLRGEAVHDEKTGTPFYIGVGKKGKKHSWPTKEYQRAHDTVGRNKYWKLICGKYGRVVEILMEDLTQEEAYEKEAEFIKLYGRKDNGTGILCNLTDGGKGNSGGIRNPDVTKRWLKKMRAGGGFKWTEARKKEASKYWKEHAKDRKKMVWTDERRKTLSDRMRGKKLSKKWRKAIGEGQKGNKRSILAVQNLRESKRKEFKQVLCLETGFFFDSGYDAAVAMFPNKNPLTCGKYIKRVCVGNNPKFTSAYGYTFVYV